MKKLSIIVAIILMPSIALATFSIQFDNTSDKKLFYSLYWIDHTYDWPGPINMAGGELGAQEQIDLKVRPQNGKYYVIWRDRGEWQNKVFLNVNAGITSVKVTPVKSNMQK
ncbi:MAG: hypothetical protein PVG06_12740 [Desulfobacterales bacterium]|jgi:hypothetical protein